LEYYKSTILNAKCRCSKNRIAFLHTFGFVQFIRNSVLPK